MAALVRVTARAERCVGWGLWPREGLWVPVGEPPGLPPLLLP